jgi:hypothetical protein
MIQASLTKDIEHIVAEEAVKAAAAVKERVKKEAEGYRVRVQQRLDHAFKFGGVLEIQISIGEKPEEPNANGAVH